MFIDIVGYSTCSVAKRSEMKERMNNIIAEAIEEVVERDRIVVDSGDGAALCFLGDPEDALFSAVKIRDEFITPSNDCPSYDVQIGINLGPVKFVGGTDRRTNVFGDGINVAQCVTAFADPNQILASQSFYEIISCLSIEYADSFHHHRTHKDKQAHEHSVYEVNLSREATKVRVSHEPAEPVQAATPARHAEPAPAEHPEESDASEFTASGRDSAILKKLTRELAVFIGPLANVIVRKASLRFPDSDHDFITELSLSITSEKDRGAFLHELSNEGESIVALSQPETRAGADGKSAYEGWDPEVLAMLEGDLAVYVGPLAKMLVRKAAQKTVDLAELQEVLSAELATDKERHEFLRLVRAQDLANTQ